MAGRRGDTFDKRQRERKRQDKAAQKRAKRQGLAAPGPIVREAPATKNLSVKSPEESELWDKFQLIKDHYRAGGIDKTMFDSMKAEIFSELGLDPADHH